MIAHSNFVILFFRIPKIYHWRKQKFCRKIFDTIHEEILNDFNKWNSQNRKIEDTKAKAPHKDFGHNSWRNSHQFQHVKQAKKMELSNLANNKIIADHLHTDTYRVAESTVLPSMTCFSATALSATEGSAKTTKPKPRARPVALSFMMTVSVISP